MRLRFPIVMVLACGLAVTACSNEEKKADTTTTPEQTTPATNPPAKETPKTEISVGSGGAEVKTKDVKVKVGDTEKKVDVK